MVPRVRDYVLYKLYKVLLTYIIHTNYSLPSFLYIPYYPLKIGGIVYYLRYINSPCDITVLSLL
jgi:hypothetical protein